MLFSIELYQKAFLYATKAHKEQKICGYPYITHLVLTASEIMEASFYEEFTKREIDEAIVTALLHDTIEDTDITYQDIYLEFNKVIADGVLALTKNEKVVKSYQLIDSLERVLLQPKHIQMVKLADRIANLTIKSESDWSRERRLNYAKDAEIIFDYLSSSSEFLSKKLKRKIVEYKKI